MSRWDAVVVGAGPAGAMAALELTRRGHSVLLVDRKPFGRRKVCGGCLGPATVAILDEAGVAERTLAGAVRLTTLRLRAAGRMIDVPLDGGVALARTDLDARLIREAEAVGAVFLDRTTAALGGVTRDGRTVRLSGAGIDRNVVGRVVIAADGLGFGLLRRAVPEVVSVVGPKRSRVGLGARCRDATYFEAGVVHMALGKDGYVGAVRLAEGSLNLAAAVDAVALRAEGPERLAARILRESGSAVPEDLQDVTWTGTAALTRAPSVPGTERVLAVGDAAGYVEPFTGEGITWALAGGRAVTPWASRAVQGWDDGLLRGWETQHRIQIRRAQGLCRVAAMVLRHPVLIHTVLGTLGLFPKAAHPVVRWTASSPTRTPVHSP